MDLMGPARHLYMPSLSTGKTKVLEDMLSFLSNCLLIIYMEVSKLLNKGLKKLQPMSFSLGACDLVFKVKKL